MNDYWNNPPDSPEPPEWYMEIEELCEDERVPQSVSKAMLKALEDWCQECAMEQAIEPPDDPKLAEGDYLYDCLVDKQWEERNQ